MTRHFLLAWLLAHITIWIHAQGVSIDRQWPYYQHVIQHAATQCTSNDIRLEVFTRKVPQHNSRSVMYSCCQSMDSIYRCVSQNPEAIMPDTTFWADKCLLLPEWSQALNGLPAGVWSAPFLSPIGYHIIRYTCSYGIQPSCIASDMAYQALADAFKEEVDITDEQLEEYYAHHKESYHWDLPHFKGALIQCKNKKAAKRIRKILKKVPIFQWQQAVEESGIPAKLTVGLFQIGQNAYIDKLVFDCGSFVADGTLPYTFTFGKILKDKPSCMNDVREQVLHDYIENNNIR